MVMRSPACFILRSVWMVTFFKVHLRILGTAPSASPRAGRRPRKVQRRTARLGPHRSTRENIIVTAPRHPPGRTLSHARAEGLVVLGARLATRDGADQVVQVLLALREVDVAGVDDQERRLVPAVEEVVVGARELGEVLDIEAALELAAALLDAREQDVEPGLQVDDQVRLEDPRPEMLVDALVEGQLVGVERDRREDPVLREQVVRDGHAVEQVLLEQVLLLLEAGEQEEELCLERVLLAVLVEAREERVLLHDLVQSATAEPLAQRARQRRLPDADGTLDHDV